MCVCSKVKQINKNENRKRTSTDDHRRRKRNKSGIVKFKPASHHHQFHSVPPPTTIKLPNGWLSTDRPTDLTDTTMAYLILCLNNKKRYEKTQQIRVGQRQ